MPDVPFSQPAFDALLTLAEAMDTTPAEAVRRALILLDTYNQLDEGQYLAIHGPESGTFERLRFRWEKNAQTDGAVS